MAYVGFKKLKKKIQSSGKSAKSAGAIAASIGRKKYGKTKFQKAAASGTKMRGMSAMKKRSAKRK